MYYLILTAVTTALFSLPQFAYEQKPPEEPVSAENAVVNEIAGDPVYEILEKIAVCESQGKHFDDDGNVLIGQNKYDVGKYQINAKYWQELAEKLGYDIYTEEGNKAMALELYKRYGTKPWKWSKKCWSK